LRGSDCKDRLNRVPLGLENSLDYLQIRFLGDSNKSPVMVKLIFIFTMRNFKGLIPPNTISVAHKVKNDFHPMTWTRHGMDYKSMIAFILY
jgi:hypothetical protein